MSTVTVRNANDQNQPDQQFEEIRRRAFALFEKRGCAIGNDLDDWLSAEREVLGWPEAQLVEKENAYEIEVTLPGYEAKQVDVTATPGGILVHAAAETEKRTAEGTELGAKEVYRRFELPSAANSDKVTAQFDKGVLRIKAPKAAVAA